MLNYLHQHAKQISGVNSPTIPAKIVIVYPEIAFEKYLPATPTCLRLRISGKMVRCVLQKNPHSNDTYMLAVNSPCTCENNEHPCGNMYRLDPKDCGVYFNHRTQQFYYTEPQRS